MSSKIESQFSGRKWYFTEEEIENLSPSRKDGIDLKSESLLRKLYCKFLQEIGIKLKVPQVTIASAMMLCHQFYMRQSHAKNDWQVVATACIFLGCKMEETPRYLNDIVVVAYEMTNKWDPSAPRRIKQREIFDQQKDMILVAERLVMSTIAFDLNIQLPYKPLITTLKRLDILPELAKVAWNFINDWMHTTLCLRYKPHYIAAGSLFLAAKLQKVKLPAEKGRIWWTEFEVSLKQLEVVIQEMRRLLGQDKKPLPVSTDRRLGRNQLQSSSKSCVSSLSVIDCHSSYYDLSKDRGSKEYFSSKRIQNLTEGDNSPRIKDALLCGTSCSGSESSVVEDGDGEAQPSSLDSNQKPQVKFFSTQNNSSKIDVDRIREVFKKRKRDGVVKQSVEAIDAEIDSEAWIENQLEIGIELQNERTWKKQR